MEEKTFTDAGTWTLLGPLIREESWQGYQDGVARDKDVNYRTISAAYGAVEIILRHAREEPPSADLIEEARDSIDRAIKQLDELARRVL